MFVSFMFKPFWVLNRALWSKKGDIQISGETDLYAKIYATSLKNENFAISEMLKMFDSVNSDKIDRLLR